MSEEVKRGRNWPLRIYALVLLAIGLTLVVPGGWLIYLGGSCYYLLAGAAVILAGVLLWRGDLRGGWVYLAMLVGTLAWALWEVGLDPWPLVPRLVAPLVLGLPLAIAGLLRLSRRGRRAAGSTAAVAVALAFAGAWLSPPRLHADPAAPAVAPGAVTADDGDWLHFGKTTEGTRHSALAQITPQNVSKLELVWSTYIPQPAGALKAVRFSTTPLKIGDSLYLCTGLNDVVALDTDTGAIRWRFAARLNTAGVGSGNCRGVTYYRVPQAQGECAERIYTATLDARLIALDARTGTPCPGFGAGGSVDLTKGMGMTEAERGYYYNTSPPVLVRGKLVLGGYVRDGQYTTEPSGVIRAFDAVTGAFAWAWDMGRPGINTEPAEGEHYTYGTPNAWAPLAADEKLGMVYVPTGNATPDYFGAHRSPESERFTASLVALDADSGAYRWHFQTVHHDVWDYDVSVQPALIDLPTTNGVVPIVAQGTKHGRLFVLDRRTGRPVFPVVERPVPQGPVAGDWLSPTQPESVGLPSFTGPVLTERDMWGMTPLDHMWCRIKFRESRYEGLFTPMLLKPTIVHPGYNGGIEWGSTTFDPRRKLLIFASNYLVNRNRLITRDEANKRGLYPLKNGKVGQVGLKVPQAGTPYGALTQPFLSPLSAPCQKPPFSRINAVDLSTGKLVWSRPLGSARATGPWGYESYLPFTIGTPSIGGPMTTATGLTFIGATLDHSFRAFDTATGRILWEADLPRDGLATPMTYTGRDGRQYVLIAAADAPKTVAGPDTRAGGTILAFALPRGR